MTLTARLCRRFVAVLSTACLAVPAVAVAQTASGTPAPAASGGATFGTPTDIVGTPVFYSRPNGLLGDLLSFHGTAHPGQSMQVQRYDATQGTWLPTATATADPRGAFLARWHTDHIGVFTLRAVPTVSAGADVAQASAGAPASISVTVFKPALATWYGPGLYGHKTACGERLTPTLVGVAHRGLPCGRSVKLLYKGRTIVAPVVDRGPFDHGATWDLTTAAAQQLGFTQTDTIGAVSLPATPVATP